MMTSSTTSGPTLRPTFGRGLGDLATSAITRIDSNPLNQLLTLDVGGMVLPRTAIEYKERGPDMGRETLIREGTGALSTVFLVGWMGSLMYLGYRLFNSVFSVDKTGVHSGSWINVKAMDAFTNALKQQVEEVPIKPVTEIRENFIRTLLQNLQATDHVQANRITHSFLEKIGNKEVTEAVTKGLSEKSAQGRLSEKALEALVKLYAPSEIMSDGTYKVFEMAMRWKNIQRSYKPLQEQAERLVLKTQEWHILPKAQAMDLAFERLLDPKMRKELVRLSQEVQGASLDHVKKMVDVATEGGLSDRVHMTDKSGKIILKERHLPVILREIKYFLEQYMDRVLSDPKTGQLVEQLDDTLKPQAMKLLDSLVESSRKTKFWLTVVPFVVALGLSVMAAPLNNWWTKRKYAGKVFFPGEGGPPQGNDAQVFRVLRGGENPVRGRDNGVFQWFEEQRRGGRRVNRFTALSSAQPSVFTSASKGGRQW